MNWILVPWIFLRNVTITIKQECFYRLTPISIIMILMNLQNVLWPNTYRHYLDHQESTECSTAWNVYTLYTLSWSSWTHRMFYSLTCIHIVYIVSMKFTTHSPRNKSFPHKNRQLSPTMKHDPFSVVTGWQHNTYQLALWSIWDGSTSKNDWGTLIVLT